MADELVLFLASQGFTNSRLILGLMAARDRTPKVIGVFCLDPGILEGQEVAPARVTYMIGSFG